MKRRDFLIKTGGVAGALIPALGRAQTTPCPLPTLSAAGGTSATTDCINPSDAQADWQSRINGAGVVWYHDFRTDAEVNNYRWTNNTGNDPNGTGGWGVYQGGPTVYRNASQGITGGCLELLHPAGSFGSSSWWRPFSPFTGAGNGRGTADPGDGGAITPRAWSPTQGGSQTQLYNDNGYYMHSSFSGSAYDGSDFWIQIRGRRDAARFSGANSGVLDVGKYSYLTVCKRSLSDQELVTYSGARTFRMYGGWKIFDPLDQAPGATGTVQPGGVTPLWQWAVDGTWDTVMYHVRPGRVGVNETLIEVYGAHSGQTAYTLFWQQTFAMNAYDTDMTGRGYQAIIASTYQNGTVFPAAFREQWAQIIFSRQFIACPQA